MKDFFGEKLEESKDGVTITLADGKNAEIAIGGKTHKTELKAKSAKIKDITKSGDNIFITFTGVIGNDETIIVSESKNEIISQFTSHGFCTKGDDWYYLKLNYENNLCDLLDKDGNAIHGFGVIRYTKSVADAYSIHSIAEIGSVTLNDKAFTVTFKTVTENTEKDK